MTTNVIIKALACCKNMRCESCPYDDVSDEIAECSAKLLNDAHDLINRLNAEIERMTKENNAPAKKRLILEMRKKELHAELFKEEKEVVRRKAIEEFAERLKKKAYPFPCAIGVENAVTIRAINDLTKEMIDGETEVSRPGMGEEA